MRLSPRSPELHVLQNKVILTILYRTANSEKDSAEKDSAEMSIGYSNKEENVTESHASKDSAKEIDSEPETG